MARIPLNGVHAVGDAAFAIVDDDLFVWLSQWAWKAKPNGGGNNVYAVRNVRLDDGRSTTIRMHRLVLGYNGPLDIDHINHCGTDNRRANLRVVSRSTNVADQRAALVHVECARCGKNAAVSVNQGIAWRVSYCSAVCAELAQRDAQSRRNQRRPSAVFPMRCQRCERLFVGRTSKRQFCSDACRCVAKRARASLAGGPSPRV